MLAGAEAALLKKLKKYIKEKVQFKYQQSMERIHRRVWPCCDHLEVQR